MVDTYNSFNCLVWGVLMTKSELCLKCMACCKILSFELPASSYDFYHARGVKIIFVPPHFNKIVICVPHICERLTPQGCGIYKRRPTACSGFDGRLSWAVKDVCLWGKENLND